MAARTSSKKVTLRHATTRQALASIQRFGLQVAWADPQAKIRGVWLHTPNQSAWAVVHTIRKHGAALEDVVVIEVIVPRKNLKRFRTGLWYSVQDVPATALGIVIDGASFGASASE